MIRWMYIQAYATLFARREAEGQLKKALRNAKIQALEARIRELEARIEYGRGTIGPTTTTDNVRDAIKVR